VTPRLRSGHPARKWLSGMGAATLLLLGAVAGPALAQESDAADPGFSPVLLMVDATGEPFLVLRSESEPAKVDIAVDGVGVSSVSPVALSDSSLDVQTSIVIDNSAESSEFLDSFISATTDYLRRAPANEKISVWTTGGAARLRIGLNTDRERTIGLVEGLVTASGANLLWDGVRGAVQEFEAPVPGAANLIVFTGNVDAGSVSSPGEARGAVLSQDTAVLMVHGGNTVTSTEARLVDISRGGAYALTTDQAELAAYGSSLSQIVGSTWAVSFGPDGVDGGEQIAVTVDGFTINASFSNRAVTSGRALVPPPPHDPSTLPGLGFLAGDTGRMVGLALGAIAAALGAYSIAMLFQKDASGLQDVLQAYSDPYGATAAPEEESGGFGKTTFMKRAVEITEGFAARQGVLERAEGLLERADMPLRAGEAMTAYAGVVLGSLAVGLVLVGSVPGLLMMGLLGVLAPPAVVRFKANRRTKKFMAQLPDTLQLLSSTLKAGYSFMQGVEAVSREVEEPMGGELRRIVTEAQLGRPLEDAMDASALRMESDDFAWAVMAVKIQREVGGNLSELLLTVAETMTARERLRRDVAALTAEGKMSAIVLGVLPILLGMAMWAMNKEYINTLFTDSLGKVLLVSSIVAALAGFAWMKKIINIEI